MRPEFVLQINHWAEAFTGRLAMTGRQVWPAVLTETSPCQRSRSGWAASDRHTQLPHVSMTSNRSIEEISFIGDGFHQRRGEHPVVYRAALRRPTPLGGPRLRASATRRRLRQRGRAQTEPSDVPAGSRTSQSALP